MNLQQSKRAADGRVVTRCLDGWTVVAEQARVPVRVVKDELGIKVAVGRVALQRSSGSDKDQEAESSVLPYLHTDRSTSRRPFLGWVTRSGDRLLDKRVGASQRLELVLGD